MIQPLRAVHRMAVSAMAIALTAIFVFGFAARRPATLTRKFVLQLPASTYLVRKPPWLWKNHTMESWFYADSADSRRISVAFDSAMTWDEPDVLLYWSAEAPQGDAIPASARLLGKFAPRRLFYLPQAADNGGHLILYSLGHRTVTDIATLEKLP